MGRGSFQDLVVWQKAIELAFRLPPDNRFPEAERFGLDEPDGDGWRFCLEQYCPRAGRATTGEFVQFLGMRGASNFEIESQFVIARGSVSVRHRTLTKPKGCAAKLAACSVSSSSHFAKSAPRPKKDLLPSNPLTQHLATQPLST